MRKLFYYMNFIHSFFNSSSKMRKRKILNQLKMKLLKLKKKYILTK